MVVASRALLFVALCRGMSGMPVCLSEWGGAVRRMEVGRMRYLSRSTFCSSVSGNVGYAGLFVRVGWGSEAHGSGANALPLRCKHRERNRTNKRRKERK